MSRADLAPRVGKSRLAVHAVAPDTGTEVRVEGRLVGGPLSRGQEVVVQPSGQPACVRRVQRQETTVEVARPGDWIAIQLASTSTSGAPSPLTVAHGDVVTLSGLGAASDTVDVWLEALPPPTPTPSQVSDRIEDRARVWVQAGPTRMEATVFLHRARELGAGQGVLAQLRFEARAFFFANDRFVVGDLAAGAPIATGRVLDPEGDRKHWQHKAQRALLEARAAAPEVVSVWIQSGLARDGIVHRTGLLAASGFSDQEVQAGLAQLAREHRAVVVGVFAADPAWWKDRLERGAQLVDRAHRLHPERRGLDVAALEAGLDLESVPEGAFDAVLGGLIQNGFCRDATFVRRDAHRPHLPPQLQPVGDWLRQALNERPLEPPSRRELTPDDAAAKALEFLIETGEAVAVGPDQVLAAAPYREAVRRIVQHLRQQRQATVSELREHLRCTRRILIPLCEKLDREGVLRREGDWRRLGPAATSVP